MAYIVSSTQTATASAATYTVTLGAHVSGDLLLVCLSQDGGGTAIAPDATSTTAGWAMIGTGAASQGCRGQWAYLIADSAAEVNPVFTGSNDDWIGTCLIVRDAHATAPFGSVVDGTDYRKADWGNSTNINFGDSPNGGNALTTTTDECLLIYSWCSDGSNQYMRCKLADLTATDKYANTQIAHIIGYRQQQAAAAAPTVRMYSPLATEGGTGWVLAVRNKSGGVLQPDIRPTITELKFHGTWETQHDSITWGAPSAFAATINGITCSAIAPTATYTATYQQTPWGSSSLLPSTESTAGSWVGGTFTITSTDMTGKVFGLQYSSTLTSLNAIAGAEGIIVGFSDGTNWVTYQVTTKAKAWLAGDEQTAFVALGQATEYANSDGDSSSSINWGAVTRIAYFWHRANSVTTSASIAVRSATLFGSTALTGGGAARPATLNDYQSAMNSWGTWRWAELQGSAQVKPKTSLQIGDGTNKTYFDGATGSLGYPQAWSATSNSNWQMDWNVNAGQVTLGVKAGANDTIRLAAGAATTANAQLLTIASDSNSGATYDFAQAFGGFTATWDTDIPAVGATFTGGGQFAAKGADFTNCTWKNSTAGTAAAVIGFDSNGAVLDGCTTVATTATGYHIELDTAVTTITLTDHTFTGSALTDKVHVLKTLTTVTAGSFVVGVHYRINTVGTTDFTLIGASANTIGVNFAATGVGSGTGTADQAVKITISGTTSLAEADVTTAGAPAWIAAPQPTLDATVLSGTRVVLYNNTTAAELDNTAPAGTAWSKVITSGASNGDNMTLFAFKEGYEEFSTSFLYSGDDTTILVTQVVDDVVAAFRTEDSITDYTTLTEYNIYAPTIYIQADDADGVSKISRLATYYNGVLTTEDGARYFRGGMSMISTGAVRINKGTIELLLENVSATKSLRFSDEATRRLYTDDGTSIIAPSSVAGSIEYAYGGVPDTVETGVSGLTGPESSQLMSLANGPSAATISTQILTDAQTTPIHSDVRKVNSYTVDGDGQTGTEWGPA